MDLWNDVRGALDAVPAYFRSTLNIEGVLVTDLHSFNSSLGTSIELGVVDLLNKLRDDTWDRTRQFVHYSFVRQTQRFPDVVLRSDAPNAPYGPILMGVELKGWYVLAKEREPSYRYRVTPAVSTDFDLLVVYPWAFSNVISGAPFLYKPYVVGSKYASLRRNWYWQYQQKSTLNRTITLSQATNSYPQKKDKILDVPVSDQSNFGRFARTGLMDTFNAELFQEQLYGISLDNWQRFFKVFTDTPNQASVDGVIARLDQERRKDPDAILKSSQQVDQLKQALQDLAAVFGQP